MRRAGWPWLVRRVAGDSMRPTLRPGALVVASRTVRRIRPGDIVIVRHEGLEKIKRVQAVDASGVWVRGDNPGSSTDSRHFGPLPVGAVMAKVWGRH